MSRLTMYRSGLQSVPVLAGGAGPCDGNAWTKGGIVRRIGAHTAEVVFDQEPGLVTDP